MTNRLVVRHPSLPVVSNTRRSQDWNCRRGVVRLDVDSLSGSKISIELYAR